MKAHPSLPGIIGRFRIEGLLGSGGMGEVYRAFDPTLQRVVALKTVRSDIDNPEYLARLYREAQACARLRHPNVVTVFEAGEVDGLVYIVMEFLHGEDLRSALKRGALTFLDKLDVLVQVLAALQHTHAEAVIHRDIKPSNVHRAPDGTVKVVDFGLAHLVLSSPLTRTGAIMCTPEYASPEQLRDEPLDARTDIYSTGAVAYEMFAGRQPFGGGSGSVGALILKAVSEPPPPMDTIWSRRFPEIERIVMQAMAKSPADRFQSAEAMRSALLAFREASRDALLDLQNEAQTDDDRVVSQAVTLIAAGRREEAETVLAATVKLNPDATRARQLLSESQRQSAELQTAPANRAPGGLATRVPAETAREASSAPAPDAPRVEPPARSRPGARWWPRWAWAAALGVATVVGALTLIPRDPGPVTSAPQPEPEPPAVGPPSAERGRETASASLPVPPLPRTVAPEGSDRTPADPSAARTRAQAPPEAARSQRSSEATDTPRDAGRIDPDPAPAPGAKQLFAGSATGPAIGPGLRYRLTRRTPDGAESDVDPAATIFHSGDRVRFTFESNIAGFLYVVQQGSSGRWTVLFPGPNINGGRNAVERAAEYQVPSGDWFLFDANPGTEQLFVLLSREPLQQLPGFDRPVTTHESVVASVVDDLRQRIQSRDLVFEQDRPVEPGTSGVQATYVVNRAQLSQAVAASITLRHAP
jgi:serine/threonine-protein kinase